MITIIRLGAFLIPYFILISITCLGALFLIPYFIMITIIRLGAFLIPCFILIPIIRLRAFLFPYFILIPIIRLRAFLIPYFKLIPIIRLGAFLIPYFIMIPIICFRFVSYPLLRSDYNNSFRCVPDPLLHNDGDWGNPIILHRVCCWPTLSSKCYRLLEENASSINGSWNFLRGYLHVTVYLLYLRYCMVFLLFLCILYIKITMAFRELSWVSNYVNLEVIIILSHTVLYFHLQAYSMTFHSICTLFVF